MPESLEVMKYDADGNLIEDGRWRYTYDALNQLVAIETKDVATRGILAAIAQGDKPRRVEFAYDYLGRRVAKVVKDYDTQEVVRSHRYLYQGWNVIAEYDVPDAGAGILASTALASSPARAFHWGLDIVGTLTQSGGVGALLMIQDGNNQYYPAYDGNGNVTGLLDNNGTAVAKYEYSPFGELLRCEGEYARENPFQWSTKWTDRETSLVYYGLRYYSPILGRFINQDPIGEQGGLNLYGFVLNNSINFMDILGLFWRSDSIQEGDCLVFYDVWVEEHGAETWTATGNKICGLDDVVSMDRFNVNPNNSSYLVFPNGWTPFDYFLDVEQWLIKEISDVSPIKINPEYPKEKICGNLLKALNTEWRRYERIHSRGSQISSELAEAIERFFNHETSYARNFTSDTINIATSFIPGGGSDAGELYVNITQSVTSGANGMIELTEHGLADPTGLALTAGGLTENVIMLRSESSNLAKNITRHTGPITAIGTAMYNYGSYYGTSLSNRRAVQGLSGVAKGNRLREEDSAAKLNAIISAMKNNGCI